MSEKSYREWWDARPWGFRLKHRAWWVLDTLWCGVRGRPGPGERLLLSRPSAAEEPWLPAGWRWRWNEMFGAWCAVRHDGRTIFGNDGDSFGLTPEHDLALVHECVAMRNAVPEPEPTTYFRAADGRVIGGKAGPARATEREKAEAERDHAIEMEARAVRRAEDAEEAQEKVEREAHDRLRDIAQTLRDACSAPNDGPKTVEQHVEEIVAELEETRRERDDLHRDLEKAKRCTVTNSAFRRLFQAKETMGARLREEARVPSKQDHHGRLPTGEVVATERDALRESERTEAARANAAEAALVALRGELGVVRNELEGVKALYGSAEDEVSALRRELADTKASLQVAPTVEAQELLELWRTERASHEETRRERDGCEMKVAQRDRDAMHLRTENDALRAIVERLMEALRNIKTYLLTEYDRTPVASRMSAWLRNCMDAARYALDDALEGMARLPVTPKEPEPSGDVLTREQAAQIVEQCARDLSEAHSWHEGGGAIRPKSKHAALRRAAEVLRGHRADFFAAPEEKPSGQGGT